MRVELKAGRFLASMGGQMLELYTRGFYVSCEEILLFVLLFLFHRLDCPGLSKWLLLNLLFVLSMGL